ncbi:MAG: ribose-phosphate pyrophosphokinase [Alphaproteobacteria bacterium]|jgi:ribose-phosphate pyrophosphokinase|nr:ribose-phosphate pyrophosphokinase [Alphaproteobacteria bacterium]MBT5389507.1 ribose-phosphate pyrophosphokinase [Alphaproteobacteria bacterium]MBT5540474.1 ribose-phosphate pyrophosphokinase [Alphaproteobacteria bacterium]MBT5654091.1 ribose-phosphate pyrophosphokinase [Alphaproteobacteria bacterium]
MKPLIFSLFEENTLADSVAKGLEADRGKILRRRFPDGETYLRVEENVKGRDIVVVDSLDQPDEKILPLLFFSDTVKELGARSIGLVAPYLAYMRQDKRFRPGEAVTSNCFAGLISKYFDWLVTLDPHLHRHKTLDEIYSIPNSVVSAADSIVEWIGSQVDNPLLIGPDEESKQWVVQIADALDAPNIVLEKTRLGDRTIELTFPDLAAYKDHTPVLVDDIISTATTMIASLQELKKEKFHPAVCIGVHGIFAGDAFKKLKSAGAERIVTCNTVPHESNKIDISAPLCEGILQQLI